MTSQSTCSRWSWPIRAGVCLLAIGAVAVFAVINSGNAHAASPQALILGDTVSSGSAPDGSGESLEQYEAEQDGFTVTVVDGATWDSMTASDFAKYQVLIIGDPTCGFDNFEAAVTDESTWEPVVMGSGGNKVLIGTDPVYHYLYSGVPGDQVIAHGIAYAGAESGATGAYVDLSCTYTGSSPDTPVPLLDGLSTHGAGQFTVGGAPCAGAIALVAQSGPTSGLTDSDLSNWECSVHEFFDHYPSDYTPLALATDPSVPVTYTATDPTTGATVSGSPYIMVSGSGIKITSNLTLTPSSQSLTAGGSASLVANVVTSAGPPVVGGSVVFSVDSGPNTGATFTGTTDGSGNTTFTYPDSGGVGTDGVSATYTSPSGVVSKGLATVTWTAAATPTTTATSLSGGGQTGATITVPAGTAVSDSATLSGTNASSATGTVTYSVYSDAGCSVAVGTPQTVTVTGGSVPNSSPVTLSTPGTYYWVASYGGDSLNQKSASACGSETATVAAPGKAPTVDDYSDTIGGGSTVSDTQLTTSAANDLIVAYVAADGPTSGGQTITVSGSSLTWTRVAQQNGALGDAEVWEANAGSLKKVTVKATASKKSYHMDLVDVTYKNATGIGAVTTAHSSSGAPTATLTTTQGNSWVWGIGNDWATATKRTAGSGQTLFTQDLDTSTNDTYWVQSTTSPTPVAGTHVTINDTAPTTDPYNLVLVELL
jgi:hypothetical protein